MATIFIIVIAALVILGIVLLVVKNKTKGILSGISFIGFIASYLLIIRYANVIITLEGITAILTVVLLNYLLIKKMLTNITAIEAYKEMLLELIPVIIVTVVFSFIGWTSIASFGMLMFWGLLLTIPYHLAITNTLINKK